MKKLVTSALAVIALVFSGTTQAQNKSPELENSLLWEVSGNGLSKPSYLYGTIHAICSKDYFLSEKTKKAFDASTELVLEIDLADPKEMADMQQMAMGKEPLSKKLSPQQLTKLGVILEKATGMTVKQVDALSMATVMSLIAVKSFGCDDIKFYEMEFIEQAKKRNIDIGGLETVKSQVKVLENAYTDDELLNMLEGLNTSLTSESVAFYKTENIKGLYGVTVDEKMSSEKTNKIILDDRNGNWVKKMPKLMKNQSVFFAVGSAHLGGEYGVINLLRKVGYKVKPIMN
ncbi:TraB/GumN family protein [Flavobacterium lipolyticum]|uniref:TraB/GumN family protein n=1 Tax=Flavobacterium lipolyticum TaxID=2893754 RepID=A0ABS8LYD9_9FLAO|nr:TraB/GumN family protein [Flavobacterium sp. F-126]MCC9017590.1 TraB/GumN family protein [Flavobacterium sp. F-126]